ncbi:hypothetical protein Cob_v003278 [Colletotrichum orbiculare MAFF 240422]|uniref:Uncharacterized protein n=1 Tax=Colletotrichum orbiculare (strain 104-T / ATCC 96160 / CBS 514.97 / LARS 414 / MAFF 240422) TaxID=1213857 RepID=A0A484G1W7_COLOR|nr:hypothetical protein Cob_v003278 [Colletotrichum orbiculare MAFF 240422]
MTKTRGKNSYYVIFKGRFEGRHYDGISADDWEDVQPFVKGRDMKYKGARDWEEVEKHMSKYFVPRIEGEIVGEQAKQAGKDEQAEQDEQAKQASSKKIAKQNHLAVLETERLAAEIAKMEENIEITKQQFAGAIAAAEKALKQKCELAAEVSTLADNRPRSASLAVAEPAVKDTQAHNAADNAVLGGATDEAK